MFGSVAWRAGGNFKCYRMSVLFYYVYHIYSACGDGFSLFPLRAHTRRPTVARWPPQVYEIGKGCLHTGPARVSCERQEHPDFHPVPGRCDDAGGRWWSHFEGAFDQVGLRFPEWKSDQKWSRNISGNLKNGNFDEIYGSLISGKCEISEWKRFITISNWERGTFVVCTCQFGFWTCKTTPWAKSAKCKKKSLLFIKVTHFNCIYVWM